MHVVLCREKRTPKRTPVRDAPSPTAMLPPLTLALLLTTSTRAWRAGWGTSKLETEFTLFTEDRTILPPIVNSSLHLFTLRRPQETHLLIH
jgi:hypothetical protein